MLNTVEHMHYLLGQGSDINLFTISITFIITVLTIYKFQVNLL